MGIKEAILDFQYSEKMKSGLIIGTALLNQVASLKGDELLGGRKVLIWYLEGLLRELKIDKQDAFVSVTSGDNTNLMASQIAKKVFQVPRVMSRVFDPKRADIYKKLGLDVISGTTLVAATCAVATVSPSRRPSDGTPGPITAIHVRSAAGTFFPWSVQSVAVAPRPWSVVTSSAVRPRYSGSDCAISQIRRMKRSPRQAASR